MGRVQGGFGPPPKTPPFSPFLLLIQGLIVNGTIVDCTAVGFFLKIRKEMGKAWHKSFTRASHTCEASLPSLALFSASFQTFCLTVRAHLKMQKYGLFCNLVLLRSNAKKIYDFYSCCAVLTAVYSCKL